MNSALYIYRHVCTKICICCKKLALFLCKSFYYCIIIIIGQQNIFSSVSRDHRRESRPQPLQASHQHKDGGQATASHTNSLHHSSYVGHPPVLLLSGRGWNPESTTRLHPTDGPSRILHFRSSSGMMIKLISKYVL